MVRTSQIAPETYFQNMQMKDKYVRDYHEILANEQN